MILNTFCKVQHEDKLTFLLGLTHIKKFIRVPKITEANESIKDEIVKYTKIMLKLEEVTLADLVDFSGILLQKFEDVRVEGNNLILVHNSQKAALPIKEHTSLVASRIAEQFGGQGSGLEKHPISLHELRNLPVIDYERQNELKAYIDALVFALYFGIPLQGLGLKNATAIRKACLTNRHYEFLSKR